MTTHSATGQSFAGFLAAEGNDVSVVQATWGDVEGWLTHLNETCKPGTVNTRFRGFKAYFA